MTARKLLLIYLSVFSTVNGITFDDYCDLAKDNIVCKRQKVKCGTKDHFCSKSAQYVVPAMTSEERNLALKVHNELRQKRANGEDERQNQKAANMHALSYSMELEFSALCFVNSCSNQIEFYNNDTPNYKDIYQNTFKSEDFDSNMKNATEEWYNQIQDYKDGAVYVENMETKAYTQVIWAVTKLIGCGKALAVGKRNKTIIACNYSPAGNKVDAPIFIEGEPASMCPDDKKNDKYSALCGDAAMPIDLLYKPPIAEEEPEVENVKRAMHKNAGVFNAKNLGVLIACLLSAF